MVNTMEDRWSRLKSNACGHSNMWYQSKSLRRSPRKKLHYGFIQRQLKRENEARLGNYIRQITHDCKDMLRRKLKEIELYNSIISQNRNRKQKCYKCRQGGHIIKNCPMKKNEHVEGTKKPGNIGEVVIKNGEEKYLIPKVYYAPEVTLNVLSMEQLERQGIEIIYENNTSPNMEAANTKGKEKIEHFGIKLEDIKEESDIHFQPIQPNIKKSLTLNKDIQGVIKRPTNSEPTDKEDTNSSSKPRNIHKGRVVPPSYIQQDHIIGKRIAFLVVEYYARNNWAKHGLKRIMMNSKSFFFFKFDSRTGLEAVLEGGMVLPKKPSMLSMNGGHPDVIYTNDGFQTVGKKKKRKGKTKSTNGGQFAGLSVKQNFAGLSVKQNVRYEPKANTSAPKKGVTNVGNTSQSSSMLKTTGKSSKKDNLSMSNSFSALYYDEDDDEKDVENVYDESAN
nr:ARID DNA-binding domain-containing protein [Tanacetum cinerariifolium]